MSRREKMRAAVLEMVGELITEDLLRDIEVAAVEADTGESDKPVKASLSIAVTWPAGQEQAAMLAKCSYSVKHVVETDCVVDDRQIVLPMEGVR